MLKAFGGHAIGGAASTMIVNREALLAKANEDRRRYLRVPVDIPGQFFVPVSGREAPCRIVDMSPAGAQVVCGTVPDEGEKIILYIEGFGRFEAEVMRREDGRFGVQLACSALKRERVAEQLALHRNRGVAEAPAQRRYERVTAKGIAHFTRAKGAVVACEVVDLSLGGVSLKTVARPPIGETVLIGQMSGRVVRHHENGIAIEFTNAPAKNAEQPILHIAR